MIENEQRKFYSWYRIMSFILFIAGMCILIPLHLCAQEKGKAVIGNASKSFLFYYTPSSKILMKDYKSNRTDYNRLNAVVKCYKRKLISGQSHLAIIAYISPRDINNLKVINEHSIQANILRSLIKEKYLLGCMHFTFYFDTTYVMKNRVRIKYMPVSIQKGSNRNVFYTLHNNKMYLIHAMNKYLKKYGRIPLISYENICTRNMENITAANSLGAMPELNKWQKKNDISPIAMNTNNRKNALRDKYKRHFYPVFGIKTNLLYWGGITSEFIRRDIIPNVEVELYLRNHISISTDYIYTYLDKDNKNSGATKRWEISAVGIEPRYWLGHSKLYRGFYMGIYGLYGQFDVKSNSATSYGHTGNLYEGGLSLGYACLFSPHWGLEIGGRVGYRSIRGDVYKFVKTHYYRTDTYFENKVKCTKINLSLIYRMGKNVRHKEE